MSNTPWRNENWAVSQWDFEPEVTKDFNFAKKIKIHDVSMRDGEQQAKLIFNKDMKVAIAEKLAEVGVQRIEAGMAAVSKQDRDAIGEICKRNLGPEIFCFCRCVKDDVKMAKDLGVNGIVVEIPSSEEVIKHAYGWTVERAIDTAVEATAYAHELGLYTVFFMIDMSRADKNSIVQMVNRVRKDGHADAVTLVDTIGGMSPSSVPNLVRWAKSNFDIPIEVHFHDDFGMGAANTVMALAAGADVAHTTVSTIGERAGNTSYEEVAMTLLTMYGVDLGLNYNKIYEMSKLIRKFGNMPTQPNKSLVGDDINLIESGIPAQFYQRAGKDHPFVLYPYKPEFIGHPGPEVLMGKFSGAPNIELWLEDMGMKVESKEKRSEILQKVKDKSFEVMRVLTRDEFKAIVDSVVK